MLIDLIRKRFDFTAKMLKAMERVKKGSKVASLLFAYYNYKLGSSIACNAEFESPPYFPHGARGVFISGGARIGSGTVIFQHVTIGSNALPGSSGYGCPNIGRNCYIGAGAIVIGNVHVGDNVRIGAGGVVSKDVPNDCVVVSQPSRVIVKTNLDNTFYSYRDGKMISHT